MILQKFKTVSKRIKKLETLSLTTKLFRKIKDLSNTEEAKEEEAALITLKHRVKTATKVEAEALAVELAEVANIKIIEVAAKAVDLEEEAKEIQNQDIKLRTGINKKKDKLWNQSLSNTLLRMKMRR